MKAPSGVRHLPWSNSFAAHTAEQLAETTLEYLCTQTQATKTGDSADRADWLSQATNDRAIATDIRMALTAREIPCGYHINPKRLARVRAFVKPA